MSTTNGNAPHPPVPINTAGKNLGKVNVEGLFRQIIHEEETAGREWSYEKIIAVARKRLESVPFERRPAELKKESCYRAWTNYQKDRKAALQGPPPATVVPAKPTEMTFTRGQIHAASHYLDACGGNAELAAELLKILYLTAK